MSTAEKALRAYTREMPEAEKPLSEQFRIAAMEWADLEAAADLLEQTKTTTLAEMKQAHIRSTVVMPDNQAEREVKAGGAWKDHLTKICTARAKANRAKIQTDYLRMRFNEWQSKEANQRHEARLLR